MNEIEMRKEINEVNENFKKTIENFKKTAELLKSERAKMLANQFIRQIIEKFPYITNNLDIEDIKKMYQLDKPKEVARFMTEVYLTSFEAVIDATGDVRLERLGEVVSYINTAKKNIIYAYENPDYKDEKLSKSHDDLTSVTSQLETKIIQYACELEKIDSRTGISSYIFAPFDLIKVKRITQMANIAFEAYLGAIALLTIIDNGRNAKSNNIIDTSTQFIDKLNNKNYIKMFYNYDKNKNKKFNAEYMQNYIKQASRATLSFDEYINDINNNTKKNIERKE